MKDGIKNAVIEAAKLEDEGRGLMAWITLIYDYGGGQGFGVIAEGRLRSAEALCGGCVRVVLGAHH